MLPIPSQFSLIYSEWLLNGTLFRFAHIVGSHQFCMSSLSHLSASHTATGPFTAPAVVCVENEDMQSSFQSIFVCIFVCVCLIVCVYRGSDRHSHSRILLVVKLEKLYSQLSSKSDGDSQSWISNPKPFRQCSRSATSTITRTLRYTYTLLHTHKHSNVITLDNFHKGFPLPI